MIAEHLSQLRRALEEADTLPESTKDELLRLVSAAEAEADAPEDAETPVNSEGEVEENPTVLDQLKTSLEEIESSHPEAAALVNRVATVLANMGI